MPKPTAARIRNALPLSQRLERGADPLRQCGLCGLPSVDLRVYREHNEHDRPLAAASALVFLGRDHPSCMQAMEAHPRLYAEEMGEPGHFPAVCDVCTFRSGLQCTPHDLRANGGVGLRVELTDPFRGAILCGRRGAIRPVRRALACVGQTLAPTATDAPKETP